MADELNISRAAKRLHIAQPPLSRQIQFLEEEMGVTLFHRTPRQLSLTHAGQAFAARARAVIEAAESAIVHARQVHRRQCGRLCLGVHEEVACTRLPSLLAGFAGASQGIEVKLKCLPSPALIPALMRGEIEIALSRPGNDAGSARVEPLWSDPLMLALCAGHPLARHTAVALELCAPYALILHVTEQRDMILSACAEAGFVADRTLQADNALAALGLAAAGLGVAFVPTTMQRHQFEGVVYRTLHSPGDLRSLTQIAWIGARASGPVDAFMRHAVDFARPPARALKVVCTG